MSSLPRRLPAHGSVKDRWRTHHEESRREVFRRVQRERHGLCEAEECPQEAVDWAHLLSRRGIIAEPWCSSPSLTAGLCRSHHNAIDRALDPDLRDRLQWVGLVRLCAAEHLPLSLLENRSPEGAARECEAALRARLLDCDPED